MLKISDDRSLCKGTIKCTRCSTKSTFTLKNHYKSLSISPQRSGKDVLVKAMVHEVDGKREQGRSRMKCREQVEGNMRRIGLRQGFPNFYLIGTLWTL